MEEEKKPLVTSNYVHETLYRLNNIKEFMLQHDEDLIRLFPNQRTAWHLALDSIIQLKACANILHYITDDLRNEKRGQ